MLYPYAVRSLSEAQRTPYGVLAPTKLSQPTIADSTAQTPAHVHLWIETRISYKHYTKRTYNARAMAGSTSGGSLLGRADRLSKFLDAYAGGNRTLKNADDAKLLFEAICSQTDREGCGEKIACSQAALLAVRPGLSFDVSDKFINGPLAEFLAYLSAPAIKLLSNGGILRRILAVAVMPPALWNALVNAYDEKQLTQQSELNFAWLLLELLLWEDGAPIDTDSVATEVTKRKDFLDSDCQALRTFGYRIQHITQAKIRNHKVDQMINERARRAHDATNATASPKPVANCAGPESRSRAKPDASITQHTDRAATTETATEASETIQEASTELAEGDDGKSNGSGPSFTEAQRDVGVSDAVWHQLLLDKAREEEAEREFRRLQEE